MSLRDRQADAAKQLIVAAALECFFEDGYVGTTMDDIADRAGVARRTIYNQFGSKAALLIALVNHRVRGAEERSMDADHQAVRALDDAGSMIERFITSQLDVAERTLPILTILFEAAAVDGEVAKEYERNEEYRYEAQQVLVDALDARGFLRTDTPISYLKRGFWLLAGPQMLITATRAGWDLETYAAWLGDTVTGLLLGPAAPSSG